MANILDVLASTFTTCACGVRTRECALAWMRRFVEEEEEEEQQHQQQQEEEGEQQQQQGEEGVGAGEAWTHEREGKVDLGPLLGTERGFRTQERVARAGGIGGVEMCVRGAAHF